MTYDVAVVGASFAGLSAAMPLARGRRKLLVVDAGAPRNRFAEASHGFLGQDGVAPAAIMREGLRQLSAYSTVDFVNGLVVRAEGDLDRFRLWLEDGQAVEARRLVLATGVRDELPALPGLAERWGRSVLHCPYCHGYEIGGAPIGLLDGGPSPAHRAALIRDWGPVTYFTQAEGELEPEMAAILRDRGVVIEPVPILELLGETPHLTGVRLADGRTVPLKAIFTASRTELSSPLATQLGCALEEGPTGRYVKVDGRNLTSVPGVFAAGDAAMAMHNGTLASASGAMAGFGAHHSLLFPAS